MISLTELQKQIADTIYKAGYTVDDTVKDALSDLIDMVDMAYVADRGKFGKKKPTQDSDDEEDEILE